MEQSPSSESPPLRGAPRWQLPPAARWVWRTLTSMRTALVLLCLLALAVIPGSLLPQRTVSPGEVTMFRSRHPALSPWLERLSLFDVFTSAWFAAVYLLLFVSLTGCVLPRGRRLWQTFRLPPAEPAGRVDRLAGAIRVPVQTTPEDALDVAAGALQRRRYRVRRGPGFLSADKGRLHEATNLMFHLSLLLMLAAVAIGHLYGFRGRVVVAEGGSFANTVTQYDEFVPGPWVDRDGLTPFSLRLRDFSATYQPDGPQRGAPRQFTAEVVFRAHPAARGLGRTLKVNQPLAIEGTKVFLTGHGYAPRFTVRDGEGNVVFAGPVPFLPRDGMLTSAGAVKAPDARPVQLAFDGFFLPTAAIGRHGPFSAFPAALNPQALLTAYTGDLGLDSGQPQSVYRLDKSRLAQVRVKGSPLARALGPGETMTIPDGRGSITFDGVSEFANFQIAHDPGRGVALAAAVLMLTGLVTSLSVRPRRVWVRAHSVWSPGEPPTVLVDLASPGPARDRVSADALAALSRLMGGQLAASLAAEPSSGLAGARALDTQASAPRSGSAEHSLRTDEEIS